MTGTGRTFVRLTGLFNSLAREFAEMEHLTEEPLILDGSRLSEFRQTSCLRLVLPSAFVTLRL